MKKRTGEPWMPTIDYARSLTGFSVNILVRDVAAHTTFARRVLGVEIVYSDADIAVYRHGATEWMAHADHTYEGSDNPMTVVARSLDERGGSVELRVHGCDPDRAEAAARQAGFAVLAPAADKPHGLREAYIGDDDGYIWVPDVASR